MTIAVAEVTAASVCNQLTTADAYVTPQATPLVSYQGDVPAPPDWLAGETRGAPGFPLVSGTGRPRSSLRTTTGDPAPWVFRAFWTAATTSVTGGDRAPAETSSAAPWAAPAAATMALN